MASMLRQFALEVRPQINAPQLVWNMLERHYPSDQWPDAEVQSEIDLDTNTDAATGQVIVYSVGAAVQDTSNRYSRWSFPVTFTVLSPDAAIAFELASDLYKSLCEWPYEEGTEFGKVSSVEPLGFIKTSAGDETAGKNIKEYVGEAVIHAADISN